MIYQQGGLIMINSRQKILDYLKKADWPSTTEDIAAELKVSWNTAQVHLLKMVNESLIKYKKSHKTKPILVK